MNAVRKYQQKKIKNTLVIKDIISNERSLLFIYDSQGVSCFLDVDLTLAI